MTRIARIPVFVFFAFMYPAASYALNPQQCVYFSSGGKTAICHATGSATNPFVFIRTSEEACMNAHADHPGDFVSLDGTRCQAGSCLPAGAPCDPTLPCCDGSVCVNGACQVAHFSASALTACTLSPIITLNSEPIVLWPPDRRLQSIALKDAVASVVSSCSDATLDVSANAIITRIQSDEPETSNGDASCNDMVITSPTNVMLRAESQAGGNGRVYTIDFVVYDPSSTMPGYATFRVSVPRQPNSPAIADSCQYCVGAGCGTCPGHDPSCTR